MDGCRKQEGRLPRVEVTTLGCKVNQAESQALMRELAARGICCGERMPHPDLAIINTCAVTSVSEAKSRKEINRARSRGAEKILVTGCLAEIEADQLLRMEGVDLVVPQSQKSLLVDRVQSLVLRQDELASGLVSEAEEPEIGSSRARLFLKVQDGCDRRCTYCIIPRARGRSISLAEEEVLAEIDRMLCKGVGEVVLCGINLGGYRKEEKGRGLLRLLQRVSVRVYPARIRLSSMDVEDIGEELLGELRQLERLCPHFHLPLQSGDDEILSRMGRGYTTRDYLRLVETIREIWDDPAITTDVMVGFPGEGEKEFANTMSFLEDLYPSRMHVFRYSERPLTPASRLTGKVDEKEKKRRARVLISAGKRWAADYTSEQVGRIREVLVEELVRDDRGIMWARGLTENYLRARLPGENLEVGGLYRVKVIGVDNGELVGELGEPMT